MSSAPKIIVAILLLLMPTILALHVLFGKPKDTRAIAWWTLCATSVGFVILSVHAVKDAAQTRCVNGTCVVVPE